VCVLKGSGFSRGFFPLDVLIWLCVSQSRSFGASQGPCTAVVISGNQGGGRGGSTTIEDTRALVLTVVGTPSPSPSLTAGGTAPRPLLHHCNPSRRSSRAISPSLDNPHYCIPFINRMQFFCYIRRYRIVYSLLVIFSFIKPTEIFPPGI